MRTRPRATSSVPVLTALTPDPYRDGYRVVEVDRGRFASLRADALAPLRLVVGTALSEPVLRQLHALADAEAALRAALRLLGLRAHARAELGRRLRARQHRPAAVEAALVTLSARGLLDDHAFAERFAATRARRGRGPQRLLRDLQAQGVERRVAETAVAAGLRTEGIDLQAEARRAAERRLRVLGKRSDSTQRRRLAGYLVRRGYSAADAHTVATELCPNS